MTLDSVLNTLQKLHYKLWSDVWCVSQHVLEWPQCCVKVALCNGRHYIIPHHMKELCSNCCNILHHSIRNYSQSLRCPGCVHLEEWHFCLTLKWLYHIPGHTKLTSDRQHITSTNETFLTCIRCYTWLYSIMKLTFITTQQIRKTKYTKMA